MLGRRIVRVWRAVVGAQVTELEANHAEAMLDQERDRLRHQVVRYNRGLAGHAGVCEKLRGRITRLEKEQQTLPTTIAARIDQDRREVAARHALRLEQVEEELAQVRTELERAEATYAELERSRELAIDQARTKIESLKRGIGDLKVQQALADLTEMAADMQGKIGLSDGTLERIQERVEEKRDYAAGRVRVARGTLHDEDALGDREERDALAQAALARFETGRDATPGQ